MRTQTKLVLGVVLAGLLLMVVIVSSTARAGTASAQAGTRAAQVNGWSGTSDTMGDGWNSGPWYARMVHTWGGMMGYWMGQAQIFGQRMTHGWMNNGNSMVGCGQTTTSGQNGHVSSSGCRPGGMMGR